MIPPQLARHTLVTLDGEAWRGVLRRCDDLSDLPVLDDWAGRGRPLVARRRCADDPPGAVALGLPLPPDMGKRRLAFAVAPSAITGVALPPSLACLACVPLPWRATVDALVALGRRLAAEPRVFGSFAWQHLTGLDYLSSSSDVDLLWPLTPAAPDLLDALARIEAEAPGRLDGELVDGAGRGVNWRELAGGGEVLAKGPDDVALVDAAAFLRGAAPRPELAR